MPPLYYFIAENVNLQTTIVNNQTVRTLKYTEGKRFSSYSEAHNYTTNGGKTFGQPILCKF